MRRVGGVEIRGNDLVAFVPTQRTDDSAVMCEDRCGINAGAGHFKYQTFLLFKR